MFGAAFLGWRHEEELNSLANRIIEAASQGDTVFIKHMVDSISLEDLEYVCDRLEEAGCTVTMTLD